MEVTTSSNTELLLSSRALYAHSLSYASDKLRKCQSCLRWMCVGQSDARHIINSLLVPLPPKHFCPHRLSLRPFQCPHSSCL
ncbi:hypothetical protein GW17_00059869 [Ensete ventricosum]|nr:hypothetical protein GW17_00059869 [Ensete ventricosum]